jgi:hypothetical protein
MPDLRRMLLFLKLKNCLDFKKKELSYRTLTDYFELALKSEKVRFFVAKRKKGKSK